MTSAAAPREALVGPRAIAALEAGPPEGPLVLCLHGFPDTPRTWRHLLPDLAAAGYHAVAPWMRGYHPATTALGDRHLLDDLATDAAALIEALAPDRTAAIVGHDWGAFTASATAVLHPDRVRAIVSLAIPHPTVAFTAAASDPDQLRRSWYIWFFMVPAAADLIISADPAAFLGRLWRDWSPGWDPDPADIGAVAALASRPEVLGEMLAYYRDNFALEQWTDATREGWLGRMGRPALYAGGRDDGSFGTAVFPLSAASCDIPPRIEVLDGCGHFLHLEKPEEVNRLVLEFLRQQL
jgi:pimeloyl-ACP methyl ester carboxylesterase